MKRGGAVELGRYLRTVRQLRKGQVIARGRLRAQRAVLRGSPGLTAAVLRGSPLTGHWPTGFLPLDGQCPPPRRTVERLADGRLVLLGHARDLAARPGQPTPRDPSRWDWEQADAPLLWRYHLHYWDWAWALAADGDRQGGGSGTAAADRDLFARVYGGWRAAVPVGHGVAWSPYVVSLRAWTLCALTPVLAPAPPIRDTLRADLATHRAFLRVHLETDVGGNHLVKNLKALVGLAVTAGDRQGLERWVDALARQTRLQVLADGGHHERAPAYHCQVLADLDDVSGLLHAAGHRVPVELSAAIDRMRSWLGAVLGPDGTVPLLNDGFPVPGALVHRLLRPIPAQPAGPAPRGAPAGSRGPDGAGVSHAPNTPRAPDAPGGVLLADSGLAVLSSGRWHVLADIGPPCPEDLPAHAHADTLGFLLWWDGEPLIVDTATSTYAPGPRRDHERSTAAHSTVTVDDVDSTEVWGAFRAGRRARPTLVTMRAHGSALALTAAHDGYRHLAGAPRHQRRWRLEPDGLALEDHLDGSGRHRLAVRFHFAPGVILAAPSPTATNPTATSPFPPGRATRRGPGDDAGAAGALVVTTAAGQRLLLRAEGIAAGRWHVRETPRAVGWERMVVAPTAELHLDTPLPVVLRTALRSTVAPEHSSDRTPGEAGSRAGRAGDAPDQTAVARPPQVEDAP